jgi:P-type Cu+ transporter
MNSGSQSNSVLEDPPSPPGPSRFAIEGMSCSNCVRHVAQAIQEVQGVAGVSVSLETGLASVQWAGGRMDTAAILEAVGKAGFKAKPVVDEAPEAKPGRRPLVGRTSGWRLNLWIGFLCTSPMLAGEWFLGLGRAPWFQWTCFALAAVVQALAGSRFYRGAWRQLQARSANMDTLVALGSTTAFVFSVWALFQGGAHHLYFMEAGAIITLISFGHWLESRMSDRAAGSLRALLHLAPAQTRRRNADGSETQVAVAELKLNDLVVLRPGDRVPADGRVVEGDSAVDESMLTGESMPVDKSRGEMVYAGTINLNGRLAVQVAATGPATALAAIIAAVERAQNSRAAIQRLADQVSNVFVPIVLLVAVLTALWWGLLPASASQASRWVAAQFHLSIPGTAALGAAFIHAAAVLIVACPCAMGLATPAAIMAAANAAAQHGILVRDGLSLEKAGQITRVVFDKTGTLTAGQPTVAQVATYVGGDRPKLHETKLAAAMARHSSHPLSQAIARLHAEEMMLLNWEEVRGCGLQCYLHLPGRTPALALARLGSLQWLRENGVDLACGSDFIEQWSSQGATLLGVAVDQLLMGLLAMQDPIKPGAGEVVSDLRVLGYKVSLITGDNERTAKALGKRVGIPPEDVHAEVRPEQKAEWVKQFQGRGERVAFVGDGLNDAPALKQANLGIAVCRASDLALEAADMVLLRSDIQAVPESLTLARTTLRVIKQNLFWAFFYNLLGIPLAALGLLDPMFCAAAMGASDLLVIGNALGLRYWRLTNWRQWKQSLVRRFEAEVMETS